MTKVDRIIHEVRSLNDADLEAFIVHAMNSTEKSAEILLSCAQSEQSYRSLKCA